jgi:hypothetical protein
MSEELGHEALVDSMRNGTERRVDCCNITDVEHVERLHPRLDASRGSCSAAGTSSSENGDWGRTIAPAECSSAADI